MARYDLGWTGVMRTSVPEKPASFGKGNSTSPTSNVFFGVVTEIISDPSKPQGTISYTSTKNKTPGEASPLLSNNSYYPIAGEMVLLFTFSDTEYNKAGESSPFGTITRTFYVGGINIWDNPSFNGVAETDQIKNPSNANYFNPNNGARSMKSFIGDEILQGRFGNSIRLGGSYNTPWKSFNPNNPITIISNGRLNPTSQYIVEDPNKDLSSIYLTTDQQLPFSIANENFNSYTNKPTLPSQFNQPQILLNSDRVVLNAKKDSILISGEKSVGLSSNKSINLEAEKIYMSGVDIRLGNKSASQAVLKGDDTVQLLKIVITELLNITTLLKTSQIYPGGVPVPDALMNTTATIASTNLNKILVEIDSIKSNFVKTI